MWDIAGQERFGMMTHVYYREAVAACIVFDVTSQRTMDAAVRWKSDIDEKVHLPNGEPVPTILLANKVRKLSAYYIYPTTTEDLSLLILQNTIYDDSFHFVETKHRCFVSTK